ncbi:hypothetical protein [Kitasatospora atroaurantiaca]|uniref:Secreted protein n=1 Tax=Kitasatospora atroaurantiaca TaxID=285545 RepID=A0A561EQK1_9ACTN|nr:hypothetical protein [Kitasatospora atroaurantiaca]TWE17892.1 hypothetical protein FB465_2933 [Kitasatospora atroaurantiaca]
MTAGESGRGTKERTPVRTAIDPRRAAPHLAGGDRPTPLSRAWWHTPRLVRGLTALCLAALLATAALAATVLGGAREGIDSIGHRAAPQAVRAADLYFALSDMDAQAANLLLIGADPDYTALRRQTQDTYEQRRGQADLDLQRAAEAAVDDPAGQRAVQTVIGELGRYEALVARAQLLEDQAHAPAGKPSLQALDAYRQATDLLRAKLLPATDEVTAANAVTVDRSYATQRDDLAAGWSWLLVTGLLALAALGALQRTLTRRFRRRVNPALAATALLAAVASAAGLGLVSAAEHHLAVAKSNAYDSVIAMSRARAVAYDMNADESRYLTDPARAAAYEQSFFAKTQSIAGVEGATLATYNSELAGRGAGRFDGFLGTELRNITFPGEQDAAERVLRTFRAYQQDDRRIRELNAQGRLKEAVTLNTGTVPGQSNADFELLSTALGDVLAINQQALDRAIAAVDEDLGTGAAVTGGLALATALALTVLGVRPRLREYR